METSQRGGSYKWAVVGMLWCICVLNYADRQAIFSVFPRLSTEFGFDKVQLGLIGSAFMWVYAAGAPLAGITGDLVRRKDLILGGCLFWSLITMLTGRCSKLWQFITVRAAEGFGETFYFPASMSMLSDYHRDTRSRAMSVHQSSVYVGTILGSWLGAWFAERHGWRVGFYFFGAAGMLLALLLYRFLREPERTRTPAKETEVRLLEAWLAIFARPAALLIMLAFVGANFVATIFLTWTPTFLVEKYGFRLTTAGLSGSVFIHLASALSVPIAGVLADKFAARFPGGRMLVQVAGLILGAIFVFFVGATHTVSILLTSMFFFGACKGFYDSNIFASIYDVVDPRVRASAAGLMNTVGWGGGALGPLAIGWLSKHGPGTEMENMSHGISYCAIIYLISAALLLTAIYSLKSQTRTP